MNRGRIPALISVALAMLFGASCQSIAGVEDYELGLCGEYCDTVLSNCTQANKVYTDRATCMGICALLPQGDLIEPGNTNTVACRLTAARDAAPGGETRDSCQDAGPTGGDRCGESECATYCDLFGKACATEQVNSGCNADCCKKNCPGVPNDGHFNTDQDYDGDTLQCRFVHLSSATVNPDTHCGHARLAKPTLHCSDDQLDPPKPPTCEAYCDLVTTVCGRTEEVYEDIPQCLAFCAELEGLGYLGESGDISTNTVACRRYHANNAISDPKGHCSHAGPGGAGHCMDATDVDLGNCETYCRVSATLCPGEFKANFADDEKTCMTECTKLNGSEEDKAADHYSSSTATEDPAGFRCRMLELTRAAADPRDAAHCAAAFGAAAPCDG